MNILPKNLFEGKSWPNPEHWEPLVVPIIVILVGLSAFALGRLSVIVGSPTQLYEEAG